MAVLLCKDINLDNLQTLLDRYHIKITLVDETDPIPGSFWHPPEAGLIGNILYVRNDTPVHSALHESCHYICMNEHRRVNLDTNAGGDYQEEDAVCYLQILLSDYIPEMKQQCMLSDMDAWGYSFRLGSAKAWFDKDAEDAFDWLRTNYVIESDIIDSAGKPTFKLRK